MGSHQKHVRVRETSTLMDTPSSIHPQEKLTASESSDPSQNIPSATVPAGFNESGHTADAPQESFYAPLVLYHSVKWMKYNI